MKCGSIEGNDGARCVRVIFNQNQSVNGADAVSDNDSYDDISVMLVNGVFVGCVESDEYFNTAKLDELKKWEQFEVYDEVKDVVQKYLTGRWVYTEKVTDEGRIPKARFVVRGFQRKQISKQALQQEVKNAYEDYTNDCCHKWLDTPCNRCQVSLCTR